MPITCNWFGFLFKIPSLMPHMIESQVMVFCRVLFFGWFFWCLRLQNPFFATFLALLQVRKVIESWMSSIPDRTKFSSKKFTARIDINWDWISSCFSSVLYLPLHFLIRFGHLSFWHYISIVLGTFFLIYPYSSFTWSLQQQQGQAFGVFRTQKSTWRLLPSWKKQMRFTWSLYLCVGKH